jgi:hypothetical protein
LHDLRQPDSLLAQKRRLRSYPRVVKAARTRFFVKQAKDVPFVFPDQSQTWKDFIRPLHAPDLSHEVLLI